MPRRLNEIDTSMYPIITQLGSVDSVLLLEIRVESGFDVVDDGFPSAREEYRVGFDQLGWA